MYDDRDRDDDGPDDDSDGNVLEGWADGDIELADPSPTHLILNIETSDSTPATPVCPDCDGELYVETDGARWDIACDCDRPRRYHIGPHDEATSNDDHSMDD